MKTGGRATTPAGRAAVRAAARAADAVAGVRVLAEHTLTPAQIRDVGSKVAVRSIPGKGLGLVARRALAAHTRVGIYAGRVFSAVAHDRLTRAGATTGKYAVDFFRRTAGGRVRADYIMDPGAGDVMHPRHAGVLAAFINEPAKGQTPNVVWVRNYGTGDMELWTAARVKRGEELTACYGNDYARKYATPCVAKPGVLHHVRPGMARPRSL